MKIKHEIEIHNKDGKIKDEKTITQEMKELKMRTTF